MGAGIFRSPSLVSNSSTALVALGWGAPWHEALLVDPVVHSVSAAEQTLEMMLRVQGRWLGYLQ